MPSEIMQVIQNQEAQLTDSEMISDETGSQFLSFIVGNEEFSVNILRVQEIRAWEQPTFLPNSPEYIKGVLNLRGTIVPVMDLRRRFRFKNFEYNATTVIIILKSQYSDKNCLMGCVVDAVSDVFNMEESKIFDVPDYGSEIDGRFTAGVMTIDGHAVTLLNLENLLSLDLIDHPYAGGQVSNG
ncbi:chemotaxis protein CheW [Aliikangiella coralliicola]|uniref:Chemotaxis protein CheW n=1 Tax=Aliikangiella coralliicola TaxID=2592383 RepID=A0A545UB64_9GAMM|nr:chemotaxis protein CheW [Aliikangiella coralliicola]TQV86716.1 purine-binding chemotaxis protein CheW [Aliikangiella coralliicola]